MEFSRSFIPPGDPGTQDQRARKAGTFLQGRQGWGYTSWPVELGIENGTTRGRIENGPGVNRGQRERTNRVQPIKTILISSIGREHTLSLWERAVSQGFLPRRVYHSPEAMGLLSLQGRMSSPG